MSSAANIFLNVCPEGITRGKGGEIRSEAGKINMELFVMEVHFERGIDLQKIETNSLRNKMKTTNMYVSR